MRFLIIFDTRFLTENFGWNYENVDFEYPILSYIDFCNHITEENLWYTYKIASISNNYTKLNNIFFVKFIRAKFSQRNTEKNWHFIYNMYVYLWLIFSLRQSNPSWSIYRLWSFWYSDKNIGKFFYCIDKSHIQLSLSSTTKQFFKLEWKTSFQIRNETNWIELL